MLQHLFKNKQYIFLFLLTISALLLWKLTTQAAESLTLIEQHKQLSCTELQHCVHHSATSDLTLSIDKPIQSMTPMTITLNSSKPFDNARITFAGTDMYMGINQFSFTALDDQNKTWSTLAEIPLCVTGIMQWKASIEIQREDKYERFWFNFTTQ